MNYRDKAITNTLMQMICTYIHIVGNPSQEKVEATGEMLEQGVATNSNVNTSLNGGGHGSSGKNNYWWVW